MACSRFKRYPSQNAFMIFSVGTAIFLLASAVGSYEAFHYTESVEFCGTTCHAVMKPEYTAYQNSPHAKVACVECHVGSGANWYVRSKLSGLYQVYAVTLGTVPKPIENAHYEPSSRARNLSSMPLAPKVLRPDTEIREAFSHRR